MNSRVSVRLCAWAAMVVAGACKENPTASLAGAPSQVVVNPAAVKLAAGDSTNLSVKVLDQTGTPLQGSVQATSVDPTKATVGVAGDALPDPTHTTTVLRVHAIAVGTTYVRVTGLGLTDSAKVQVQ